MISKKKEKVTKTIDAYKDRLIEVADFIHDNPETGYQEKKSSALLVKELESKGFTVEKGISGLETSFKATYKSGSDGPTIAYIAEYDALPEKGHACDHNINATTTLGAAVGLASVIGNLHGSVVVYGTPAEEGFPLNAGGKVVMMNEIAKSEVALMVHSGTSYSPGGRTLARENFVIRFKGKASHAAAAPEKGINALDAAIITFNSVNALRQHVRDDVRIHGIIKEGGVMPNIVPDYVVAHFFVRANTAPYMRETFDRVLNCARGAALATGCKMEYEKVANTYENMVPIKTIGELFSQNLRRLGIEIDSPEKTAKRTPGSTDLGNVSHLIPCMEGRIAIAPEGTAGHSVEFKEAAKSDLAYEGMIIGAKALAMTGVDLLENPELIVKAKKDLETALAEGL
ncbi:M20 family metallopeptidase [Thermoproteota archaeon]